jgi:hypothetical protein
VAALQQTATTVPIVFASVVDPVGAGFVASLARPGGNTTGFTANSLFRIVRGQVHQHADATYPPGRIARCVSAVQSVVIGPSRQILQRKRMSAAEGSPKWPDRARSVENDLLRTLLP